MPHLNPRYWLPHCTWSLLTPIGLLQFRLLDPLLSWWPSGFGQPVPALVKSVTFHSSWWPGFLKTHHHGAVGGPSVPAVRCEGGWTTAQAELLSALGFSDWTFLSLTEASRSMWWLLKGLRSIKEAIISSSGEPARWVSHLSLLIRTRGLNVRQHMERKGLGWTRHWGLKENTQKATFQSAVYSWCGVRRTQRKLIGSGSLF